MLVRVLNMLVFALLLLLATTPVARADGECGPLPSEFLGTLGCPEGSVEVYTCVHISGTAYTWAGSCRQQ